MDTQFLVKKLENAVTYDRIAGYFCSSILEVAGESIENVEQKVRVICNSYLEPGDVKVASYVNKMKQEWCEFLPEEKYSSEASSERLLKLYKLLHSGKLEVRVIPNKIYGLMHGKAGVITYQDGTQTSFIGSANETQSGFTKNYEMIWEDNSKAAVEWVMAEFEFFWTSKYAVDLCDFIIDDIERIGKRKLVNIEHWKRMESSLLPSAMVEEPICRKELGLWDHQKYFVELAFREHRKDGGARLLLADQVGLGKTIQLAMSAKLMALYGDKPILIIVPKSLLFQWQDEMLDLLDMPSAIWTNRGWQDEVGNMHTVPILKCPRKVGIISQGLISRGSESINTLLNHEYECVIVDEAHKARRKNLNRDADKYSADPNNLLKFLNDISMKTKSLLLATATPVQISVIEAFDLVRALSMSTEKVMGNKHSKWIKKPQTMLDIICEQKDMPTDDIAMWDIMRNPFPPGTNSFKDKVTKLRNRLDISDNTYTLSPEYFEELRRSYKNELRELYIDENFIRNYNPYIRSIVRRTREYLEKTINPKTGLYYLEKIDVKLHGEAEALPLEGNLKQAYLVAEDWCKLLSTRVKSGGFMSTLILKRLGSTIVAGEKTTNKLLAWSREGRDFLANEYDMELDEEVDDLGKEIKDLTNEEVMCLQQLKKILSNNTQCDPKYTKTKELLLKGTKGTKPWKKLGCIIFSQYYDSAYFIASTLSIELPNDKIGLYAGGDKSGIFLNGVFKKYLKDDLKILVRRKELKILVGTDAASEGLNLQSLGTLINIDLPWNPTKLEQRKGRIQRIGQDYKVIHIYNMRYADSVEDKVHKVLSARLKNIKDMFGQIPDTLDDIWINIALQNEQAAQAKINGVADKNPFSIKYEVCMDIREDWDHNAVVLDNKEKKKLLLQGW